MLFITFISFHAVVWLVFIYHWQMSFFTCPQIMSWLNIWRFGIVGNHSYQTNTYKDASGPAFSLCQPSVQWNHSFSTFVPSFGRDIKHKLGTCFNLCAFQTQLASSPHSEEFLLTVAFVPLLLLLHSFKGTFSTFPCCCQRCSIVSIFPTLTS